MLVSIPDLSRDRNSFVDSIRARPDQDKECIRRRLCKRVQCKSLQINCTARQSWTNYTSNDCKYFLLYHGGHLLSSFDLTIDPQGTHHARNFWFTINVCMHAVTHRKNSYNSGYPLPMSSEHVRRLDQLQRQICVTTRKPHLGSRIDAAAGMVKPRTNPRTVN